MKINRTTRVSQYNETNKKIRETNDFRRKQGRILIERIKRECLRCGKKFSAIGKFNRLCGCVKSGDDYLSNENMLRF